MYGKSFESMYSGSMVGAGINVFAVWGYILTLARNGAVEINPKVVAFILGGEEKEIEAALKFLEKPDPESRSKAEGGRRLVREGQFQYRVVNWEVYQGLRSEEARREYNRRKQAEHRDRVNRLKQGKPLPGEVGYCKQVEAHGSEPQAAGEQWPEEAGVETVVKPERERA